MDLHFEKNIQDIDIIEYSTTQIESITEHGPIPRAEPLSLPNPKSPQNNPSKAIAWGPSFPAPDRSQSFDTLKKLTRENLSDQQIKDKMLSLHDWTPSDAELAYAKKGMRTSPDPEIQALLRDLRQKDHDATVQVHMILLQIMMGDIAGAVESYAKLADRDAREYERLLVDKLGKVREARSQVIRGFAEKSPPKMPTNTDDASQKRFQDQTARYTQYVQMTTQLMSQLQDTEREMQNGLENEYKDVDSLWESIAQFRDEAFRTDERVMTMR